MFGHTNCYFSSPLNAEICVVYLGIESPRDQSLIGTHRKRRDFSMQDLVTRVEPVPAMADRNTFKNTL